jgi:cell wall assembly regulator SMI1
MTTLADGLLQMWRDEELALNPGASKDEIQSFEERNGVVIPEDMRQVFERANGMANNMWDGDMIAFHPLERMVTLCEEEGCRLPEHRHDPTLLGDVGNIFVFADYLISSHYYAIRLFPASHHAPNEVLWLLNKMHAVIAPSFSGFLERYIADRNSILFPDELPDT